ncbi:MAG: ATP-binding protein [Flavobacteriaceae bacterium]|nr:ATP-binding protein [Flavobacteriaceae bacterium]
MKLTKKVETEVTKTYDNWLHSYLNGDVKTYDFYLDKDYRFIGSTNNEEFLNKKDTTKFLAKTADQLAGKTDIRNNVRTIDSLEGIVFITDLFDAYFLIGKDWTYYGRFRFTSALSKKKAGWRFIYQHFSMPDAKAKEGETLGAEQISKENQELRDAIKRRTVELEHKNRELEIESSLEKVRAKTMAMQHSDELANVATVLFEQVKELGIPQWTCGFNIWETGDKEFTFYPGGPDGEILTSCKVPLNEHPIFRQFDESRKRGDELFVYEKKGEIQADHYRYMLSLPDVGDMLQGMLDQGLEFPSFQIDHIANFSYGNMIFITYEPFPEMHDVFKRFAKVFEQTYTRFLDLQKAEEQAREAQIETALERVRSKTMAMHNSQDVKDAVRTLFEEILKQNDDTSIRCGIGILSKSVEMELWTASFDKNNKVGIDYGSLNMNLHPLLIGLKKTWKAKKERFFYKLKGKELVSYFDALNNAKAYTFKTDIASLSNEVYHNSFVFSEGVLFAFTSKPIPEYTMQVLKRFTAVFEQTYTRFLDLQKAEAQAKEAQIEASLERVRSKTMAMHNSKDVGETVVTLFNEVLNLGIDKSIRCGIGILNGNEGMQTWSASYLPNGELGLKTGMLDMKIHPLLINLKKSWEKSWEKGKTSFTYQLIGNDVFKYYQALNNKPEHPFNADLDTLSENEFHNSFFFSEGILFAFSPNPIPEEALKVLKRFTAVFEQTYTRFLDLQKAEAQLREAQIEASLERVRAKAMAMHKSEDLVITANQLFQEFQQLEISFIRCGVLKINKNKTAEAYSYSQTKDNKAVAVFGNFNLTGHEAMEGVFEHWKLQKEYVHEMKGEAVKRYYKLLNKQIKIPELQLEKSHFGYVFYFPEGCLYCFTNEKFSEDTLRILRKFNTVMGLTYRRYFELQEAEARELAAVKESSLDRVRAEIASMQTADDLNRITPLVWKELNTLGVPFFRCGVFIVDQKMQKVHAYLSTPSGESLAALELEFDSLPLVIGVLKNWKQQKVYIEKWNKEQFIEFTQPLLEQGQINSSKKYQGGLEAPEQLVLQMVPFKQGMLYVGSEDSLTNDQIATVESLAKAFSVAYTRYEDFKELEAAKSKAENTLSELKATQTQLIQSEKMASLGELTAGIAHEIQNPLNFVNNFSEVSEEMLEELEEEIKDNSDEIVIEIMNDLKHNLNKITNHGKRASNIVKGMLDHSRTGSGISELTDINKLADEYLRLSYHGLRAKDKTFNADFKSDLDDTIPKIEIVAQDIGRVILNLINNAFYACTERSRSTSERAKAPQPSKGGAKYKPKVTVSTSLLGKSPLGDLGARVEIRVKDNGSGIPEDIKDKIFQPFFTTKPTGSGTGLGLSLAYDIITKGHGGELKVESKEGEFTKFTIVLPYKN